MKDTGWATRHTTALLQLTKGNWVRQWVKHHGVTSKMTEHVAWAWAWAWEYEESTMWQCVWGDLEFRSGGKGHLTNSGMSRCRTTSHYDASMLGHPKGVKGL